MLPMKPLSDLRMLLTLSMKLREQKRLLLNFEAFLKVLDFSALRLGYTVIPQSLHLPLNSLWTTRLEIKSNGVSFPIQKAAIAAFMPMSRQLQKEQINKYLSYAQKIKQTLQNFDQRSMVEMTQSTYGGKYPQVLPTGISLTFYSKIFNLLQFLDLDLEEEEKILLDFHALSMKRLAILYYSVLINSYQV